MSVKSLASTKSLASILDPNVGPEAVDARTNHMDEKTCQPPARLAAYDRDVGRLPEMTAEARIDRGMDEAVDAAKPSGDGGRRRVAGQSTTTLVPSVTRP